MNNIKIQFQNIRYAKKTSVSELMQKYQRKNYRLVADKEFERRLDNVLYNIEQELTR